MQATGKAALRIMMHYRRKHPSKQKAKNDVITNPKAAIFNLV
jgi:hypothetical protein